MRFRFIAVERAHHAVAILCRCLQVTPSGFYAWRRRPESVRARTDRRLKVLVRASFDESKQRYGSPRVHEDLMEQHERVSRKRVVRLMQEQGLKARSANGTSTPVPTRKPIHWDSLRFSSPSNSLRSVMPTVVSVLLSLRSLIRSRAAVQLEILALRHQLKVLERSQRSRLRLTATDRLLWVWFSRIWSEWRPALVIVQPATVLAWHRRGFRLFWTWKSRSHWTTDRTGRRPRVDPHDVSSEPALGCTAHPW